MNQKNTLTCLTASILGILNLYHNYFYIIFFKQKYLSMLIVHHTTYINVLEMFYFIS